VGLLTDLTSQADALKASGRMDEALAAYKAIVEIAPQNLAVIHNFAAALCDSGRYKEAIEWATRAIKAGLNAPEAFLVLARSYASDGNIDLSRRAFLEVLARRPADAVAHKELAQLIWMTTADVAAAMKYLNGAIAAHPRELDLRLVKAHVMGQSGDAKGEFAEVLIVLSLSNGHPNLHLAAANAALAAADYATAHKHALAAFEKLPNEPSVLQALAHGFLAQGEPLEAARVASRLRTQYPLNQFYIALQATCWRLLGDERYPATYDYSKFVHGFPLACPPGWASVERYIDELTEALDRRHQYRSHPFGQSVRGGSQLPSINTIDEPALKAVEHAVRGPMESYIARIGVGPDPLRIRNRGGYKLFSIWSIRLASSGYHIPHVHPQGWLSSACHLRFPKALDANDKSGWIAFGEPGAPTRPVLQAEHFVRPQKGVMVVFPSYMWHGTVPFAGDETRLSIAADCVPAAI
jgi:tetratricopeptide (TPR) repeat protein